LVKHEEAHNDLYAAVEDILVVCDGVGREREERGGEESARLYD
jgi:hypothetical protein